MHSPKSIFVLTLAAALVLASLAACSVESREERQQRLAAQQSEQAAAPDTAAPETAAPETAAPDTTQTDQGAAEQQAPQDMFSGSVVAPDGTATPETATPEPATPETAIPDAATPGAAPSSAPDPAPDLAQDPAEVVQRFFDAALARDIAALSQLVTKDQQHLLPDMLAEVDQAMNVEGDRRLIGVDKVEALQVTRTADVDVNVTLHFQGGAEVKGDTITLRFEDGAWRIADVVF